MQLEMQLALANPRCPPSDREPTASQPTSLFNHRNGATSWFASCHWTLRKTVTATHDWKCASSKVYTTAWRSCSSLSSAVESTDSILPMAKPAEVASTAATLAAGQLAQIPGFRVHFSRTLHSWPVSARPTAAVESVPRKNHRNFLGVWPGGSSLILSQFVLALVA